MYSLFQAPVESDELRIPKSSLGYTTNNQYRQFPPLMNDGRSLISNWQTETVANKQLIQDNHITSNWMYRKYLTQHATDIMKQQWTASANDTGYTLPLQSDGSDLGRGGPATFRSIHDETLPSMSSDLKTAYVTQEQMYDTKRAVQLPSSV